MTKQNPEYIEEETGSNHTDDDDEEDYSDLGIDDFSDIGSASPIQKHSDLLKDLTDFDPSIQRRIRNWLGLEWDENTKKYEEKNTPIINLRGAKWAIGFLGTYLNKTNIITNISDDEYRDLRMDIVDTAWIVFLTSDDFGVKNNRDWYRLATELQHSAELVLMGAGNGKYTKFLGTATNRNESINLNPQTNQPMSYRRPGVFSGIKNKLFGGGR